MKTATATPCLTAAALAGVRDALSYLKDATNEASNAQSHLVTAAAALPDGHPARAALLDAVLRLERLRDEAEAEESRLQQLLGARQGKGAA